MKQSITTLLETPMQRADFLKTAGALLVLMTGVGTILRALTDGTATQVPRSQQNTTYGVRPYGGGR